MRLETCGICSGYGKMQILNKVDVTIESGSIVSIVGPNGCGKSTLLKTITGYLGIWEGRVLLGGENITGLEPQKIVAKGLTLVAQGQRVFRRMSVRDNLEMGGYLIKDKTVLRDRIESVYSEFPVLRKKERFLSAELSGGEQMMLCIARALVANPKFLLMDEPSIGLAPIIAAEVFRMIKKMRDEGKAILLVEQKIASALEISDRAYVLDNGQVVFAGSPNEVNSSNVLEEVYLGPKGNPL